MRAGKVKSCACAKYAVLGVIRRKLHDACVQVVDGWGLIVHSVPPRHRTTVDHLPNSDVQPLVGLGWQNQKGCSRQTYGRNDRQRSCKVTDPARSFAAAWAWVMS